MKRSPIKRRIAIRRVPPRPAGGGFAASTAQRVKVAGGTCVVCNESPCDPAHLAPRAQGGCGHPDCVVALCRRHHRDFDERRLALLPHLEPDHRRELAHAVGHLGLVGAMRRLTGGTDER